MLLLRNLDTRGNASVEMISARLGHFVVLQCPLHADNSSSISWTKDSRQLEFTSDNLTLTAVRSIDAGLYQCARFTSPRSSLTALINVIILGKIIFCLFVLCSLSLYIYSSSYAYACEPFVHFGWNRPDNAAQSEHRR